VNDDRYPCRFSQSNRDRREIYAVVERDGGRYGYGPLTYEQIRASLSGGPSRPSPLGPGDPELAASLAARAGEFHGLEDFYRFSGYPADVVAWVEATQLSDPTARSYSLYQRGGRDIDDVITRLGVEGRSLLEASDAEVAVPGHYDPEGNPLFLHHFGDNWAIGDLSGWRAIDPRHYRFKAWLSFHT
jgi:hypothetical protein